MDNKNEQDLRFLQLRFIGKILAGFTHEIKNHLAIVKESAGLMGDMLKMGKTAENGSQYLEIIHSIEEQIERALVHFTYLNRFSHRMDTSLSTFNINESIEELTALLHRFANQKRIRIEKDFQKDLKSINSNPSMLQFLVFNFLEEAIAKLDKNGRIVVKTEIMNGSAAIRIIPEGNVLETDAEKALCPPEIIDYVIKMLNGNISRRGEGTMIALPMKAA
jgi:nitrogen-specific signal transduction histidine kinase